MKVVRFQDLAQHLEARKAALGIAGNSYVAVNPGGRRTESKRELLRAMRASAEERGVAPRFAAKI